MAEHDYPGGENPRLGFMEKFYDRWVDGLLEDEKEEPSFEVEFVDEDSMAAVTARLEARGCQVTTHEVKLRIVVTRRDQL